MQPQDIAWNDEARAKILDDSDRVLREAVLDLSRTMTGHDADEVYSALYAQLKDRFIDFEPGPDIRTYADAIANGEIAGDDATSDDAGSTDAA
ncbi:hypothetical protein [Subtercola sp. YIM 133946]|uniref:hypothetical protein n=1 Tax=Subtercola sp. YIM 133946 TaxID=3118909 RepID=UPI002F94678B